MLHSFRTFLLTQFSLSIGILLLFFVLCRQCFHRLELEQMGLIKQDIAKFIKLYSFLKSFTSRFEERNSIDAIVEDRKLYRPCLIREMLKQKFSSDDKTVEEFINNPSTIPDSRYVSLVLFGSQQFTDRFRVVIGQVF